MAEYFNGLTRVFLPATVGISLVRRNKPKTLVLIRALIAATDRAWAGR